MCLFISFSSNSIGTSIWQEGFYKFPSFLLLLYDSHKLFVHIHLLCPATFIFHLCQVLAHILLISYPSLQSHNLMFSLSLHLAHYFHFSKCISFCSADTLIIIIIINNKIITLEVDYTLRLIRATGGLPAASRKYKATSGQQPAVRTLHAVGRNMLCDKREEGILISLEYAGLTILCFF